MSTKILSLFILIQLISGSYAIPTECNYIQKVSKQISCKKPGDPVCGYHGTCVSDLSTSTEYSCKCDPGWMTPNNYNTNQTCSYEQKSETKALIFQVLFGYVQVGGYYLGWSIWSSIPWMALGIYLVVNCALSYRQNDEEDNDNDEQDDYTKYIPVILNWSINAIFVIWWWVTFAYIAHECYDSNCMVCN